MGRENVIYADIEPTEEVIQYLVENHRDNNLPEYKKLQNYYEGRNEIIDRKKADEDKPNNKLVSGYPSYIVDMIAAYFVGSPVTYSSTDDEMLEVIQDIFDLSDEQDENSELAKMAGIKGKAYEIVYVDEESSLRFEEFDADDMFIVYNTSKNPIINFAILINWGFELGDVIEVPTTISVYTDSNIIYYQLEDDEMEYIGEEAHYFGQVPVIEFLNNEEGIGDFERLISMIDAYDKATSDTANDLEEFTDALLCLFGMMGTQEEDIRKLKEDGVLLFNEGQGAEWLIKQINDEATENHKDRLNNDIHKFAMVPDMTDEKFAGNVSGESMKYKLFALNQVTAKKNRKFKRALQKRLELICIHLANTGKHYDYRDIDITFTNNAPQNEKEMVEMAKSLVGFTSTSTALSLVPGVDNIQLELEKIREEKESYFDLDYIPEVSEDDREEV